MNPYEILGAPPTADRAALTAAFRERAKSCHPDLNPDDPGASEKFILLQEALRLAVEGLSGASSKDPRRRMQRRDLRREVTVGIDDAVRGTTVRLDGVAGPCSACDGEGSVKSDRVGACPTCGGSGISGYRERGIIRVKVGCPDCGGSGRTTRISCSECMGVGFVPHICVDIEIPAGCRNGEVLSFPGAASDPGRGLAGDLEIVVSVDPGKGSRVVGDDVETDVEVEVWEAALGTERTLTAPGGGKFKLAVPAGTQHGRRFTLKGKGLGSGPDRGAFVAVVTVRIPRAVDPAARAVFLKLKDEMAERD